MYDFIITHFAELLWTAAVAILGGLVKRLSTKVKRLELVEGGIQALLRDRLIQSYNHYIDKGYCPIYAQENMSDMYEKYHALGGNGTATKLMNEVRELPTEPPRKKKGE